MKNYFKFLRDPEFKAVIVHRGFLVISGVITVVVIPYFLTGAEQGLFFIFVSIAAIQSLLEAGITSVFFNFVAHEWGLLTAIPSPSLGDRARIETRLKHILRMSQQWFLFLARFFTVVVGSFGFYFLSSSADIGSSAMNWQSSYCLLISAIAVSFLNMSKVPILEGIGQIANVAKFRFRSNALSATFLWVGIVFGLGVWALALSYLIQSVFMALQIHFTLREDPLFSGSIDAFKKNNEIDWRSEIFPLQLRLAGSYLCGYFITQSIVPFTLHFYGLKEAGQVGLMLSIFNSLAVIVASYMYVAGPKYASLIAQRNIKQVFELFIAFS